MPLRAIKSRSLPDQVFEQIVGAIMNEQYPPGTNLPPERSLSQIFEVNRHVVREALKRLEQVGLVTVSQGGGTTVVDYKRHAGLDILVLMAEHARGGEDVAAYWLAVLEMRSATGADIARLCALRADAAVRKDLVAIAREMSSVTDDQKLFLLEVRFWDRAIDGAGNIAYRLSFNTLLKGVLAIANTSQKWSIEEIRRSGSRMPLAMAIATGNADKAEADVRTATRATVAEFAKLIGKDDSPSKTKARRAPSVRARTKTRAGRPPRG